MRRLLVAGAKVDARGKGGESALMLTACYAQSPACVRLLLKRGADVRARDRTGADLLFYASRGQTLGWDPNANAAVIRVLKAALLVANRQLAILLDASVPKGAVRVADVRGWDTGP